MNKKDFEKLFIPGIILVVVLIFFYIILGASGALAVLGIVVLFMLPMYLILDAFELDEDEKIVFSFFIGVGILPSMVFWLALYISFRISVTISFLLLLVIAFAVRKMKKNA